MLGVFLLAGLLRVPDSRRYLVIRVLMPLKEGREFLAAELSGHGIQLRL